MQQERFSFDQNLTFVHIQRFIKLTAIKWISTTNSQTHWVIITPTQIQCISNFKHHVCGDQRWNNLMSNNVIKHLIVNSYVWCGFNVQKKGFSFSVHTLMEPKSKSSSYFQLHALKHHKRRDQDQYLKINTKVIFKILPNQKQSIRKVKHHNRALGYGVA